MSIETIFSETEYTVRELRQPDHNTEYDRCEYCEIEIEPYIQTQGHIVVCRNCLIQMKVDYTFPSDIKSDKQYVTQKKDIDLDDIKKHFFNRYYDGDGWRYKNDDHARFIVFDIRIHRNSDFNVCIASEDLKNNKELPLFALEKVTMNLVYADDDIRADPDYVLVYIVSSGTKKKGY